MITSCLLFVVLLCQGSLLHLCGGVPVPGFVLGLGVQDFASPCVFVLAEPVCF